MAKQDYLTPPPTADPLSPEATMATPSANTATPNAAAPATAAPNSAALGANPAMGTTPAPAGAAPTTPGMPSAASTAPLPGDHHKRNKIIIIITIVVLSLLAATFIGLFIWKSVAYNEVSTDVEGQKAKAASDAVNANTVKLENEFAEREKYPYTTFSAPDDYGGVSFEFPKTWSVYVAKDAQENKGDYEAYLNPGHVDPVSAKSINALRVTIKTQEFNKTVAEYDKLVEKGEMTFEARTFVHPDVAGEAYSLYRGQLPNKNRGAVAIFKVRDKSVIVQTDAEDFIGADAVDGQCSQSGFLCPVLNTMRFNK